jgi:16S rRNA C1402 N4-methylase RsmH
VYSPDAQSCLDIAGNSGFFASLLEEMNKLDSIISIDYDENAIEIGRERLKGRNLNLYLANPFVPLQGYDYILLKTLNPILLLR